MAFAVALFFFSLVGIAALLGLKQWESTRSRVVFPSTRRSADQHALRLKTLLFSSAGKIERLPPLLLQILRGSVRLFAVAFGRLAHWVGERSHALADLVSPKHRFERRETNSEFLRQIDDHPLRSRNGNGNGHSISVSKLSGPEVRTRVDVQEVAERAISPVVEDAPPPRRSRSGGARKKTQRRKKKENTPTPEDTDSASPARTPKEE